MILLVGEEGAPLDAPDFDLARRLAGEGEAVALFADPARVVIASALYLALAGDGVRLGADPFSAYAVGGEFPLWPLEAVQHEVANSIRLFSDVLGAPSAGFALPGPSTRCAGGDYLFLLSASGWPIYGWPGAEARAGVVGTAGEPRRRVVTARSPEEAAPPRRRASDAPSATPPR